MVTAIVLALGVGDPALAQCPPNPGGGPTSLTLTTSADGTGTDFDVGKHGGAHGLEIPGLALPFCLDGCDASIDPECTITSVRPDPSSRSIAPPMPIIFGNYTCASLRFPVPAPAASGSANVQTGALDVSTILQMRVFAGSPTAICPICIDGTCDGGANHGDPCQIERSVTLLFDTYDLSTACQPRSEDLLSSVDVPVDLVTGTASQATCPLQGALDVCGTYLLGSCDQTTCTSGPDGIIQDCCSMGANVSCVPPAGVTRQGQAIAPTPEWPSTTYPKQASGTVASTTCVTASGSGTVDQSIGLPGPAAVEMDVTAIWKQVDTTTTTTTLGSTTTTTIPVACDPPCEDDDSCTTDTCTATTCTHALTSPGIAGARCLVQRMRARPLCGTDRVDVKLAASIGEALAKVHTLLSRADTAPGRKRTKVLKKVRARLTKIDKRTNKAATRGKIADGCKATILGEVSRIRDAFADAS